MNQIIRPIALTIVARILSLLLLAGLIAIGCKKKDEAPPGSSVETLDASKFFQAFSSSPAEVRAVVDSVIMSIQGANPVKAREELDHLAKMSGVTDAQQAAIKGLSTQLDKNIARSAEVATPKQ